MLMIGPPSEMNLKGGECKAKSRIPLSRRFAKGKVASSWVYSFKAFSRLFMILDVSLLFSVGGVLDDLRNVF